LLLGVVRNPPPKSGVLPGTKNRCWWPREKNRCRWPLQKNRCRCISQKNRCQCISGEKLLSYIV